MFLKFTHKNIIFILQISVRISFKKKKKKKALTHTLDFQTSIFKLLNFSIQSHIQKSKANNF